MSTSDRTHRVVIVGLVGFQNRLLLVLIRWSISFATRGRGARLIASPANADAAGRPAAHPEPGATVLTPPNDVVFTVPDADADEAIRDPFRYAP